MKLIIASNNQHKIREIKNMLGDRFSEIISLKEANISHEVVEDGNTFMENAYKKAKEISDLCGFAALADDSGICVDYLEGAPGIYSARFSGGSDDDNNALLLQKLRGVADRGAHYTCAMALVFPDGREVFSEGYMFGEITENPVGDGGFGYDPLFIPTGEVRTVAQMSAEEKNAISHRANALRLLVKKLDGEV